MDSKTLSDLAQLLLADPATHLYLLQHANNLTLDYLFVCASVGKLRVSWRTALVLVLAALVLGCFRL